MSSYHNKSAASNSQTQSEPFNELSTTGEDRKTLKVRQKAEQLIAEKKYEQTIALLNTIPLVPEVKNLKGVCLLRMGQAESAVQWYRNYLIYSGTTRTRTDLHESHTLNFAAALLMSGRPAGCLEVLGDLPGSTHPAIPQIEQAIRNWSRSLGFWDRFNWWVGKLAPEPCAVPLNFVPGWFQSCTPTVPAEMAPNGTAQTSTHTAA